MKMILSVGVWPPLDSHQQREPQDATSASFGVSAACCGPEFLLAEFAQVVGE